MKTTFVSGLLFLLTTAMHPVFAQQALTYIDSSLDTTGSTRHTEIKAALDKLVEKATDQLARLEDQLKRTGDYLAEENRASVLAAQEAVTNYGVSTNTVKTNAELAALRAGAKGEDVFDATKSIAGVFEAVSPTYTKKTTNADGTVTESAPIERVAADYDDEAKRLQELNLYYQTRDAVIQRQRALEAARLKAHQDLLKTTDSVETQRLTALISSIDSELIAIRQDIANANHELEVFEKASILQQTVEAKTKREELGRKSKGTPIETIMARMNEMLNNARNTPIDDKRRGRIEPDDDENSTGDAAGGNENE